MWKQDLAIVAAVVLLIASIFVLGEMSDEAVEPKPPDSTRACGPKDLDCGFPMWIPASSPRTPGGGGRVHPLPE